MMAATFWAALIKQTRKEKRISQRSLATLTRINRATLRRIEDGVMPGDISTIEVLLNYLGYDLEAIDHTNLGPSRHNALIEDPKERSRVAAARIMHMSPFPLVF